VAFARWDPVRDLLALQQHLDRLAPEASGWTPPVDIYETASAYVVTAELPGVGRGDVQIHVQDGHLHLSGTRSARVTACEQFHRVERGHGTFHRVFHLPVPVDADRITADLRDGVLTVTCPKSTTGARQIRVS
jgi:HSP20 family protein